jgi:hypothetical protein
MRRWLRRGLLLALVVLSVLLWGALRSFSTAAGVTAFTRLSDHDYVADIEALRQQDRLDEALALSRFVCDQPTYPQQSQACDMAQQLDAQMHSLWYRMRSIGHGALTGAATNGWALAGATTADFFVVGDVRDLLIQGWRLSQGQEVDKLLLSLSAVGVLTATMPEIDWIPSFGKIAARLGALSDKFADELLRLSRRAVESRALTPLRELFGALRRTVSHLGPARTLGILPVVDDAEELATISHLASRQPWHTYGLLKTGGRSALAALATTGPEATADLLQAARKGSAGLQLFRRFGRRLFASHLLVGAGKALHRGRLPQAMSLWLAAQAAHMRVLTTAALATAWCLTIAGLWRLRGRKRRSGSSESNVRV